MNKLKCKKCGYEWYPRDPEETPKQCPKCKRYDWQEGTMVRKRPLNPDKLEKQFKEVNENAISE